MNKMKTIFLEAQEHMVGGAGSGGRYHAIFKQPFYLERAEGSKLYNVDGKEFLDFHTSAGAAFFGYNHPRIIDAAQKALDKGYVMNFESEYHTELANLMSRMFPCGEMVRFANTGTEATMAAIRLARGYTGKDIVIRFEGHFHGMHELIWYNHNGQGEMDEIGEISNIPDTAGIPACFSSVVKNVEFNDIEALERVVERYRGNIAAICMEPISFNCGCYMAHKDYLIKVRELCDREGIVLIFDEIITGLRLRPGCAQAYYNVIPDLATMGKAVGGGFPMAALVGKKKIMMSLNPVGKVGVSGTYTASLMAVLVSIECMKMALEPDFYNHIDNLAEELYGGMNQLFKIKRIPGHVRGVGARFGIYFGIEDPEIDYNWRSVKNEFDLKMSRRFIEEALNSGMYFHDYGISPVPAHNGFGVQHSIADIQDALNRIDCIFEKLKQG